MRCSFVVFAYFFEVIFFIINDLIFAVTRGKWTNMVQSMKKFKKVFYVNQFSYTHKMIYILDIFIFQTLIQEKLLRLCFILFMFSWTNLVQSIKKIVVTKCFYIFKIFFLNLWTNAVHLINKIYIHA